MSDLNVRLGRGDMDLPLLDDEYVSAYATCENGRKVPIEIRSMLGEIRRYVGGPQLREHMQKHC